MSRPNIVINGVIGVRSQRHDRQQRQLQLRLHGAGSGGSLDIRATAGGVTTTQTVLVPVRHGHRFRRRPWPVPSASLAASPSVVAVNTGRPATAPSCAPCSSAPATRRCKNVRVRFDLAGDANNIGGSLTSGTNVVYSDANGVATTAYVPGSRFSPTDGLTVRACWSANDFPAGTCPNAATATLTVVSEALSVSIVTRCTDRGLRPELHQDATRCRWWIRRAAPRRGVEISQVGRHRSILQGRLGCCESATSGSSLSVRPATTRT